MRHRLNTAILLVGTMIATGGELAIGCSATEQQSGFRGDGAGDSMASGSQHGAGGLSGGGGTIESAGALIEAGANDAKPDVPVNPCGTKCGPVELCDADHLGLDDDCNGKVDEGCSCNSGQVHFCFKGDPSYEGFAGCFDGRILLLGSALHGLWTV